MGSKRFTLNLADFVGLARDAVWVGAAAAITYVIQHLGTLDFGDMGAFVVPLIAIGLDAVVKWLKDGTKEVETKE
jgi:hypothetical protein